MVNKQYISVSGLAVFIVKARRDIVRKKQFAMVIISVIPIIILILAIIGYNSTNKLAFSKENIKYTQKKVKIFMKEHNDKNGIYLYC